MTKICPIYPQYNGNWYFYEDIGQLVSKWLPPKLTGQSEEGAQNTAVISGRGKGRAFDDLYVNMKEQLELAYILNQQIQDFSWYPLEDLHWSSKDEKGNDRLTIMSDVLPSKEALQLLLIQSDRCNAFAAKLWLENPYRKSTDQNGNRLTPVEWYALSQQLGVEIGKAEDQANSVTLDTIKKLADIDRELGIQGTVNESYVKDFQAKHGNYVALLDEIIGHLEKSRLLASEIGHLEINPSALNVP